MRTRAALTPPPAPLLARIARARRLSPDQVRRFPVRERILALARERGGATLPELCAALGLRASAAHYHVQRLRAVQAVRVLKSGRANLVVPAASDDAQAEARALLRRGTAREVARVVASRRAGTASGVADALALSPRTAYTHVARLRQAGLLARLPRGRLQATPLLVTLLAEDAAGAGEPFSRPPPSRGQAGGPSEQEAGLPPDPHPAVRGDRGQDGR